MGTESTGLLLPQTSLLSPNIPIQPSSSAAEHPAPSLWKGEHIVHWSSAVMGWACSKHSIFRHCRINQSSPLTQQINSIIKECSVCWKTLNGHRQVKVNHPYSRRPWSTRDGKGNSNLIARDKMITFCYHFPVPSKVAGSLLYTAQKKSLQHQAGVRYLTMPIRLEVKIQKFSSDIKYLR